MKDLKPGAHIHLMGICGTAMASLAGILKERGFKITGSDQNVYPPMSTFLEEQGIEIMQGYKASNLDPAPDFVVVGNVIAKKYEEAQALLETNIPYASLPETMRDVVIEDRHSVVVCGTHGKTTTTSMAAWVCEQAGLEPGFMIGGIAKNFSKSFKNPSGNHFVIEGDEYDTAFFAKVPKFLFYKPDSVILTSVEFDHADIYKDLDDVLKAFSSLMEIIPEKGVLIYNAEDQNIDKLLPLYKGTKISYGYTKGDWSTKNIEILREGLSFDVLFKGQKENNLFIPMFGKYNIANALAVYALAKHHDWNVDMNQAFSQFLGVKRRQELIGEPRGIQVIEDFAHHPTAVKATLQSFQERKGGGKLFAIFEPRSNTSRRSIFQKEYAEALKFSDRTFIGRPMVGNSPMAASEAMSVDKLSSDISDLGGKPQVFSEVEEILPQIAKEAQAGDTIVIMSNGGFQGIYSKLLKQLQ